MQYDKIFAFMEDGKEYEVWDFCRRRQAYEKRGIIRAMERIV